jgi:hypothetical protein
MGFILVLTAPAQSAYSALPVPRPGFTIGAVHLLKILIAFFFPLKFDFKV